MKLKYIGLAPISNKYGTWKQGDVKNVPNDCNIRLGEFVKYDESSGIKSQILSDKSDKTNKYFIQNKKYGKRSKLQ